MSEETRHTQLMDFLNTFKSSMENKIDTKLEKISVDMKIMNENQEKISSDMKSMKGKIEENQDKSEEVSRRMDARLTKLEEQMKKSAILREKREELINYADKNKKKEEEFMKNTGENEELIKSKNTRKDSFSRRKITTEDLIKEPVYKSTWASEMEAELAKAAEAGATKPPKNNEVRDSNVPKSWEDILDRDRHIKPKTIRKPPKEIIDWFADANSEKSDSSSSSSESTEEEGEDDWKKIECKKKNKEKLKNKKLRNKSKMAEMASRMQHMIGIGPIYTTSIKHFEEKTGNNEEAKELAIKEYLSFHLDYNAEELNELKIKDTKLSANEDLIYFALENKNHIREIYFRRAACSNDDLTIREYIPPQYYQRWMAIGKKAAEMRAGDSSIKTQMRWGDKDIEIYTKTKGSQEPF